MAENGTSHFISESAYQGLSKVLASANAETWLASLPKQLDDTFQFSDHGKLAQWLETLEAIPQGPFRYHCLDDAAIQIGEGNEISNGRRQELERQLQSFHPWRKGPYRLLAINIETEWRSDWKWERLIGHIAPLKQRLVLDVGCGNGYHCWRMFGAGAKAVIGIDPLMLNVFQFLVIKRLMGEMPVYVLPLAMESVPGGLGIFDSVFSMGVLYHRRSPIDHLLELRGCLRQGGELILETLVIEGGADTVLLPESRYAKMRNVWFLPSCDALMQWLKRVGFVNIRLVDKTVTTTGEQRSTPWMRFQSLADFLDKDNPEYTCEGLPAPQRAIFIANNP